MKTFNGQRPRTKLTRLADEYREAREKWAKTPRGSQREMAWSECLRREDALLAWARSGGAAMRRMDRRKLRGIVQKAVREFLEEKADYYVATLPAGQARETARSHFLAGARSRDEEAEQMRTALRACESECIRVAATLVRIPAEAVIRNRELIARDTTVAVALELKNASDGMNMMSFVRRNP